MRRLRTETPLPSRSNVLHICYVIAIAACTPTRAPTDSGAVNSARSDAIEALVDARATDNESNGYASDGGLGARADVLVDSGVPEEPYEIPTQILTRGAWVPVRRAANRNAPLAGYLRGGSIVALEGSRVSRETCPIRRELRREGGWYKLATGGYVCVGGALATPWREGDREPRSAQPDSDASLPYRYAIVYGRTAMFRDLPSRDDLRDNRGWRLDFEARPDGGEPRRHSHSGDDDDDRPRRPGLGDLRGEHGSPVIRRLMTGMYVALDRTISDHETDTVFWRTQSGGFVPAGPLSELRQWSDFRGVAMDATTTHLPYAFMNSRTGFLYHIIRDGHAVELSRRVARHRGIQLQANQEPIVIGEDRYWRTEAEPTLAVKEFNVGLAALRHRPDWVRADERWIDIDLQQQVMVAYDGDTPAYATLVSTGKRNNNEMERYNTPTGQYRIYAKHITTTMDGDTAMAGPYSIEDVPWVMYFWESYAIHGAFWHGQWGWRMSHGCVNMAPNDARWMFFWANPPLPNGWHGVFAGQAETGSPVIVHMGDRPPPPYRPRRRRDNDDY